MTTRLLIAGAIATFKTITPLALGGAAAGNYTVSGASGTVTITARALAVSATGVNKVYDGTTTATVTLSDNNSPALNFGYNAPVALDVENARAAWSSPGVRVEWTTHFESDVLGFNVYRSQGPAAPRKRITYEPILPKAAPNEGATYSFTDAEGTRDTLVYYWLEVIARNERIWIGPLTPKWKNSVRIPTFFGGFR